MTEDTGAPIASVRMKDLRVKVVIGTLSIMLLASLGANVVLWRQSNEKEAVVACSEYQEVLLVALTDAIQDGWTYVDTIPGEAGRSDAKTYLGSLGKPATALVCR